MSQLPPLSRPTAALFACLALVAAGAGHAAGAASGDGATTRPARASAAKPEAAARERLPASAAAAVDPVEQLRARLAGRLAAGKAVAGGAGGGANLQVVNVPPAESVVAPEVLMRPRPAAPRPRAAAPAANASQTGSHGSSKGSVHWSYSGEVGPQAWGGIRPEFSACARGERQSPIDIREGIAVDLEPIQFRYQPSGFSVIDNGHTVQVNMAPGNSMEIGGRRYELQQFHFHRPSEERIDGRQFDMSVHLVHKDPEGRMAVVGVLLGKGAAQPVVQTVWNNLPLEKHQDVRARVQLDPSELLPTDRRYYTYMGSLTTPPCSEGVQWVVMREPVTASPDQIDIFSRLYPMNARPVQNAAGRRILQSQ